jgi:hypothetical protein
MVHGPVSRDSHGGNPSTFADGQAREDGSVSKSDDYAGISGGEDDIIYWQDALEAYIGQRPDKMGKCPFCQVGVIKVTKEGRKTRLECQNQSCRHFIEGRFGEEEYNV